MKKSLALLLVLSFLSILAAACGGGDPVKELVDLQTKYAAQLADLTAKATAAKTAAELAAVEKSGTDLVQKTLGEAMEWMGANKDKLEALEKNEEYKKASDAGSKAKDTFDAAVAAAKAKLEK